MVFSSTAAAAQQHQYSSSGGGDVELLLLVPAPRVKPERQMKKMEHRSGTFFRDSAYYNLYALRADQHCGSCSAMHRGSWNSRSSSTAAAAQQQQHSSSGGSDVAAMDEKDERGYAGEPFVFVLGLSRNFLKRTSADTPRSLLLPTAVLLCR